MTSLCKDETARIYIPAVVISMTDLATGSPGLPTITDKSGPAVQLAGKHDILQLLIVQLIVTEKIRKKWNELCGPLPITCLIALEISIFLFERSNSNRFYCKKTEKRF